MEMTMDKTVSEWNQKNPVGTWVRYFSILGMGEGLVTRTRYRAFKTANGPMIFIECVAGYVYLEHVFVLDVPKYVAETRAKIEALQAQVKSMTGKEDKARECLGKFVSLFSGLPLDVAHAVNKKVPELAPLVQEAHAVLKRTGA